MPLPEPTQSESQDQFLTRCMREAEQEYPRQDQRMAVCYLEWKNKKR